MPIEIDDPVKIKIDGPTVSVEGPKGKLQHTMPDGITCKQEEKRPGSLASGRLKDATGAARIITSPVGERRKGCAFRF